jgi:oligopeptide/dipeptide ABC transporter ATP-binding protein
MIEPDTVLMVENLKTWFRIDGHEHRAVDGISFRLQRGKTLAIVGESGCGKSVASYSLLRLVREPGRIVEGRILFHPRDGAPVDIARLTERDEQLYRIRGGGMAMIFQEPMTALSPVHTVGNQLDEAIRLHHPVDRAESRRRAAEMLGLVGIPAPVKRLDQYPHELSGGQRQRVVIAMALVCRPQVLIADEPTTALDVTIQAQILRLLKDLQRELGTALLLITHNVGVVAQTADTVAVMYLGRIVESGPVEKVLLAPRHPYTRGLLASLPGLAHGGRLASIPGSVPPLDQVPTGCRFHPRCQHALQGRCTIGEQPVLEAVDSDHFVACWRWRELSS